MINTFKALHPLNILWMIVILFLLRLGYFMHMPAKVDFAFADLFKRLLIPSSGSVALSPLAGFLIACGLVFIQALLLNYLVNHNNLLGKPTFLPALMYITVSALFQPFLMLCPPMVCNFLLIWMLFKLFDLYKGTDAKSTAYDLGMIVAIGSIIYLPFNYLFLAILIALVIFRPFNWREWVAGIIGYLTIFFFLAVYYYLNNSLGRFSQIWLSLGTRFPGNVKINYINYAVLIPVILILVLCFFTLQQNFFKSYVQTRKSFQLLFMVFLVALLSFYIKAAFRLNHFLLCAVPVAVFFSYYFLYAKRRWFYETLFGILLAGIIYFQFNTF